MLLIVAYDFILILEFDNSREDALEWIRTSFDREYVVLKDIKADEIIRRYNLNLNLILKNRNKR